MSRIKKSISVTSVLLILLLLSISMAIAQPKEVSLENVPSSVSVLTYKSSCPAAGTQMIMYSGQKSYSNAYFVIHGDGKPSLQNYCTKIYGLCDFAAQSSESLVVGIRMEGDRKANWGNKFDFSCLYNEAKQQIESLGVSLPQNTILAGFSGGGQALRKTFVAGKQPAQVSKTIFFDASYGTWASSVAKLPSSARGDFFVYYRPNSKTEKDALLIQEKNYERAKIVKTSVGHGSVPKTCLNDHLTNNLCSGKGTLVSSTITSPVQPSPTLCTQDLYIPLAYPNALEITSSSGKQKGAVHSSYQNYVGKKYSNGDRPEKAPKNSGYIYIPKEACGKTVDLLVAYHGWRSLTKPNVNIFIQPPTQSDPQKHFDRILRKHLDAKSARPMIIAAPMHDKGPEETVWGKDVYNINNHISLIENELSKHNIKISKVSLIGHSNANCGGGLARAASELSGYPLYLYGAADGTCKSSDFLTSRNVFNIVSQKNAILFHMRQKSTDHAAATAIKKNAGGPDPQARLQGEYTEMWRSNDEKMYTYATKSEGHSHTTIPWDLLEEILPRFFSPAGAVVATNNNFPITPGVPGATLSPTSPTPVSNPSSTSKTITQKVPKELPHCQLTQTCQEIDEIWSSKVSLTVGGEGKNKVWAKVNGVWRWSDYESTHFELKKITVPVTSSVTSTTYTTTSPTPTVFPPPKVSISDCPVTQTTVDSQSIGSATKGTLQNGIPLSSSQFIAAGVGEKRNRNYGTKELVNLLELVSCYMYKNVAPTKIQVNDLSLQSGGDLDPSHASHNSGRDADIGIYYYDGSTVKNKLISMCSSSNKECVSGGVHSKFNNPQALKANWEFIKALNQAYDIDVILLDKELIKLLNKYAFSIGENSLWAQYSSTLKHYRSHHHHYHIRIKCPQGDNSCTGKRGTASKQTPSLSGLNSPPTVSSSTYTPTGNSLRLVFGGDATGLGTKADPFAGVRQYFENSLTFINLETLITNLEYAPLQKSSDNWYFRVKPGEDKLKSSSVEIVSLANNHAGDFGKQGLHDTISYLNSQNIAYCGAGSPINNPVFIQPSPGVKVAYICVTQYVNLQDGSKYGRKAISGLYEKYSANRVEQLISSAKQAGANVIIVSFHWGETHALNSVKKAQKAAIDAGAHLAVGHGHHKPLEHEIYNGKLVVYGLGNLVTGKPSSDSGKNALSNKGEKGNAILFEVVLDTNGNLVNHKRIPLSLKNGGSPQPK